MLGYKDKYWGRKKKIPDMRPKEAMAQINCGFFQLEELAL
jgi:hypothetical protein